MRNILKSRTCAVIAGAGILVTAGGIGTATAATGHLPWDTVGTHQVRNNSLRSVDLHDGSVRAHDLSAWVQSQLAKAGTPGPAGQDGQDADPAQIEALQNQITALQQSVNNLENPTPSAWSFDNGEGDVTGVHSVDLTMPDNSTTGASFSNGGLSIPLPKGDKVSFTYSLSNGAQQGWGAPRVIVEIGGTWYSTVGNVTADYGTDNGNGTYTQSAVPVTGNTETPAPRGIVEGAAIVYDNLPHPGTVHIHNLTIGDQVVNFK